MDVLWASGQPPSLSALIRQSPQRSWKDRSAFSILNGLLKRGLIYEAEQATLSVRVAELTATLEQAEEKADGVDAKTVSNILGHYSAGFTLDTYTHTTSEMQKAAVNKMGSFIAQAV